jgi:hydrogenase maturation factor HypF (carbamoyltransferase family)
MVSMKIKIKITGSKVHDVGYRPYLTELAISLALRGFEVYNDDEDGQQVVVALIEGDEQRITKFYNSIKTERPTFARVDNVKSEDYAGDVMPSWHYAAMNTSSQMNKAIPLLLDMRDDLKALREDIQPGFAMQFRQVQSDVKAIKERLGMS